MDPDGERYDRQLLLFGNGREKVLDLWEVQRYGSDSFGDPDHVSVYGMRPADWFARGVRLLGRTAVECTRDVLADAIAADVATVAAAAPTTVPAVVIDPFAGSGNTLYWIARRLPGSVGHGFELDVAVFRSTRRNLAVIGSPVEVVNVDYAIGLPGVSTTTDGLVVVFVAPPWGDALDPVFGLDLRRTDPPVGEVVDVLVRHLPDRPLLVAVQVYERVDPASLGDVAARFDWSELRVYHLDAPGRNHGVLLATRGWRPPETGTGVDR